MSYSPKLTKYLPTYRIATVAAGCFWGVEHIYRKTFLGKGLIATEVGYSGGDTANPTYKQVCTSSTNYAEALQIVYDPKVLSYEDILDFFFRIHDPTTLNSQGPDKGTQYRSAIFTQDLEEQNVAEQVKQRFQDTFWSRPIVTDIIPIKNWYDAEDYHQKYLEKNKDGYECPTHFVREKGDKWRIIYTMCIFSWFRIKKLDLEI